jgi:hypothetical protein
LGKLLEKVCFASIYLQNRIFGRKYLRPIPKVFLIDAYEVSCRARADKVAPR